MLRRLVYKQRKFYDDDFDWDNYTADSYQRRIKRDIETTFRPYSTKGELSFDTANGRIISQGAPIHPNQELILEVIGRLAPQTVHEAGCGGGDHIATVAGVFPKVEVSGGDRGATQLDMALSRHPELAGRLGRQDLTMPFSDQWPKADLVYSQAVLMHIHTAVSHFVALANLAHQAQQHVLLVENVQCHDFVADLNALHQGGHLPWKALNLYVVRGSSGAQGILMSKEPQPFDPLTSDAQLREGSKVSKRRLKRGAEDSARGLFGFRRRGAQ